MSWAWIGLCCSCCSLMHWRSLSVAPLTYVNDHATRLDWSELPKVHITGNHFRHCPHISDRSHSSEEVHECFSTPYPDTSRYWFQGTRAFILMRKKTHWTQTDLLPTNQLVVQICCSFNLHISGFLHLWFISGSTGVGFGTFLIWLAVSFCIISGFIAVCIFTLNRQ